MDRLPIIYSYRQVVVGNQFFATVYLQGHAILSTCEADEVWMEAVAPAGFAAVGPDRGCAFAAFRDAWHKVLIDIANDSANFSDFHARCGEFLSSAHPDFVDEWQELVAEVNRTGFTDEHLSKAGAKFSRVKFEVRELSVESATPKLNSTEAGVMSAA